MLKKICLIRVEVEGYPAPSASAHFCTFLIRNLWWIPQFFQILHGQTHNREEINMGALFLFHRPPVNLSLIHIPHHHLNQKDRHLYVCLFFYGEEQGREGLAINRSRCRVLNSWPGSFAFLHLFRWEHVSAFPPTAVLRDYLSAAALPSSGSFVYKRVKPYHTTEQRKRDDMR